MWWKQAWALGSALSIVACSGAEEHDGGPPDAGPIAMDVCEGGGLLLGPDCASAAARLVPVARAGGAWVTSGDCAMEAETLRCPSSIGALLIEQRGERVRVGLEASEDVVLEGLAAEGPVALSGATTWLSNGFQSWSQSGAIEIGALAGDPALFEALAQRGDAEVLRRGAELSWEYTVAGGGETAMLIGALDSARWRPWVQVGRAEQLRVRIGSGGLERVAVASGETVWGEPFRVAFGDVEPLLTDYAAAIDRDRASTAGAEAGWNSWYELWDTVDEDAVRANAARAGELLGPRVDAPLRIVVDDGWQVAWGDWTPNEKFPSGLDGLASDLRADGFTMGVWMAPLLADEESAVAIAHPEWMVGGATYEHAKHGTMRVLDVTNPEVEAHLREVIARIVSWGYDLLKIDFLFAGTFEGDRSEDVTGMEAFHRALAILRDAAGDDVRLVTVGAPGLASLPYADAWRVGGDIALEPFGAAWPWVPNQARSVAARYPLCLRVLCDADPPLLRDLAREEVETGAEIVAASGGALFLSDDLRALADERAGWALTDARVRHALAGAPALPVDFLPAGAPRRLSSAITDQVSGGASTHVVPTIWRMPDGARVAINVSEAPITIEGVEVPPRGTRALP